METMKQMYTAAQVEFFIRGNLTALLGDLIYMAEQAIYIKDPQTFIKDYTPTLTLLLNMMPHPTTDLEFAKKKVLQMSLERIQANEKFQNELNKHIHSLEQSIQNWQNN